LIYGTKGMLGGMFGCMIE